MPANAHTPPEPDDPGFAAVKEHILTATGLAYYRDKDAQLWDRIQRRLRAGQFPDCRAYLRILQNESRGEEELIALAAELTIGETFFFRHPEQFDAIRDRVLPDILTRNRESRRLRIWHAGCSIGAEPYSMAILLGRDFGIELAGWDQTIIASDINHRFLAEAREGRFKDWTLRASGKGFRDAFFDETGDRWTLRETYRRHVTFQYHNLARHPFPSLANNLAAFDIIFCRNVMIYFDRDRIQKLVAGFHETLVEGGWLVVGPAENDTKAFQQFHSVSLPGATLYQRLAASPGSKPPRAPLQPPLGEPDQPASPLGDRPKSSKGPPALKIATDSPAPLLEAVQLADRGLWELALDRCEALLATDPLRAEAHFLRALLLDNTGHGKASEEATRKAIYLERRKALPHYHLGMLLRRRKDWRGAAKSFHNALDILMLQPEHEPLPLSEDLTVGDMKEIVESELKMLP